MSEWKDIETAPKDGTHILAFPCFSGALSVTQVSWRQTKKEGWHHWTMLVPITPTHWMPLPEPPKE